MICGHPVIDKFTGYLLPVYWTTFFFLNSRSRHRLFNIGVYRINVRIGNASIDQRVNILCECVLVLKRERNGNSDNILFIDASNDFEAGKNQNILRECDIDKIVETYERRKDVDKYAHVATMQEIEENGFNLNIPRYVDTFEPEEEIDLNEVAAEIRKLQSEIKDIDAELKPFFDELGLDFPFEVEGK